MCELFNVQCSTGNYSVKIESGSFEKTLRGFAASGAFIIADDFFALRFEELGIKALFLHATEKMKSLDDMPYVAETMRGAGVNRHTELVAVGGGVIQDIVCFIASVYMRGIKWSYIPTTVLAMVDSCIGGKSSINVGPYKNLVGTFHPPRHVFIDPDVAKTLPQIEVSSGLIEALKICYCKGATLDGDTLEEGVVKSLQTKKWFIETDEFDENQRLLLNFGHTFGHAIESATNFAIPHGIAVGIGMLCAIEYSGFRPARVVNLENRILGLLSSLNIPPLNLAPAIIIERFKSDKKHGLDYFTMVLLDCNGDVVLRKTKSTPKLIDDLERVVALVAKRCRKSADDYWTVASIGS